jgi:hypothetical protein
MSSWWGITGEPKAGSILARAMKRCQSSTGENWNGLAIRITRTRLLNQVPPRIVRGISSGNCVGDEANWSRSLAVPDSGKAPTWHRWRRSWTELALSITASIPTGYGMPSPPRRHGAKMPGLVPYPVHDRPPMTSQTPVQHNSFLRRHGDGTPSRHESQECHLSDAGAFP